MSTFNYWDEDGISYTALKVLKIENIVNPQSTEDFSEYIAKLNKLRELPKTNGG